VGITFPRSSTLPGTRRGILPLIFRPYVVFTLHNCYFAGTFETSDHKIREPKIERNTTPCRTQNVIHPAKRGVKRVEIEVAMLDFDRSIASSSRVLLPPLAAGLTLSLCVGRHRIDRGLSPRRYVWC